MIFSKTKAHLTIAGIIFFIAFDGHTVRSHMGICAHRCAEKHCGLTANSIVFECRKVGHKITNGHVEFHLSDDDKAKLHKCYKLVDANTDSTLNSAKYVPLKNNKLFQECLRCCKVELLNWCKP